jgi:hypothetical protein
VSDPGRPREQSRQSNRVAVDAFVKLTGSDGEFVFRTRDLSTGGLFLYTRVAHTYPFGTGARLQLELYDYDEVVACEVEVVRIVQPGSAESGSYPTGFGVRICRISSEARGRLERMIVKAQDGGLT